MLFTAQILKLLEIDANIILKKPIRGYPGITAEELVFALIHSSKLSEASELLGYNSDGPIKSCISKLLLPIFPSRKAEFGKGFGSTKGCWRFELLLLIEHKFCSQCNRILPFSNFTSHIGNDRSNLSWECSACHTYRSKLQKIDISHRTPAWADMNKVRDIYVNTPPGYHVDHIVPLRGTNVSGLHVENNLQYLTPEQNLIKSNTFEWA